MGGRWLWRDLDLAVATEERVGLRGETGAGKTMLLRVLALLDEPDEGEVFFGRESPAAAGVPEHRARVLYLHQRPVFDEGTVEEALRRPFSYAVHRHRSWSRPRVEELLDALGRPRGFLDQRTRELSGGEAQSTALVRALLLDPAVLLLDEPTASLDEGAVARTESLLADWHGAGGRTWLWTSHDRAQLERTCERVIAVGREA